MSRDSGDNDNKVRLICDAWNGSRTPAFRKFKRDFQAGTSAMFLQDDDHSVWHALTDVDQGGQGANAEPLPGVNQAGHANAVRRRRKRQAKGYQIVYVHIDNERIKEMLSALPLDDRRGTSAWSLVLRQCDQGTSDLQIEEIKLDFANLSVEKDIGYSEETMTQFSQMIDSINSRFPIAKKKDDSELTIKFLSNIIHPDPLALGAVTEIDAPEGTRRFEKVVNGAPERDYDKCVQHFDKVWTPLKHAG